MRPAAFRVLKELAADDEIDILCEGGQCYCGNRRIHPSTVKELLWLMAIKQSEWSKGCYTYNINETGRRLLRRPDLEGEIQAAIRSHKPFTYTSDDRIKFI